MTDEELNRKFDIVAALIADLAVGEQKADERMARMDARTSRTDERLSRTERILTLSIRAGRRERREWREQHAALVDAQMYTEQKLAELAAAQTNLAESQAHSDRRLDALIDIVRRDRDEKSE